MDNALTANSGQKFFFNQGITDKQIDQLVSYAQTDETVKKYTSDAKRFASKESFDAWRKDSTRFYTLTDVEDNLMGIIWLEDLPLPEVQIQTSNPPQNFKITFAIRLYGKARGQGLSAPFTQKALRDFNGQGIWLATSVDNLPAISSYKKSGFTELGIRSDGQKLLMILP